MEIDKFKDRLAISFKECGLTPQQITDVIPRFPVETSILENISANSPYFNFKEKITCSANLLKISPAQFITAAVKQPPLFCQKPETLYDNVTQSAQLMDISPAQFIAAAVKQPSLFYQKPETLYDNVTQSAQLMDISPAQFIAAAVKQPQLFYQKPETIHRHAKLMREFNKRGIITLDVEQYYLKQPASLCLSDDNFKLRLTFAEHTGLRNQKNFSLLKCTRKDIEHAMVETLGYDPENKKIDAQRNSNSATLIIDMVNDKRIKGYQIAA